MSKVYSLTDTLSMMSSDDYKERFLAEYIQVCIRLSKLTNMLERLDNDTLSFKPDCPSELLRKQADVMLEYGKILQKRAKYESIELPSALYIR